MSPSVIRLAVLISGGGRTLLNLCDRIEEGVLHAKIETVLSSRADAPGVVRAHAMGLPVVVVDRRHHSPNEFQKAITQSVGEPDLICMAGFLSLWQIPDRLLGRVINIHPALLPRFGGKGMYGMRVHEAVLAARETETGCTVHFCDNEYDHGPIILQRRIPVLPGETAKQLARRVFEEECIAYPQAINLVARGRIRMIDGGVTFADSNELPPSLTMRV